MNPATILAIINLIDAGLAFADRHAARLKEIGHEPDAQEIAIKDAAIELRNKLHAEEGQARLRNPNPPGGGAN